MKKPMYILALLTMVFCSKAGQPNSEDSKQDSSLTSSSDPITSINNNLESGTLSKEETLQTLNNDILMHLKSKDFAKFADYIHPEKGIQFSMYAHIKPEKDKHFSKEDFQKYVPTNIKFTWGEKDGTSIPLVLSTKKYLEEWVHRIDFGKGEFHLNTFKGSGNSLNNLKEIYPTQDFTENYLPGSEELSGLDWNCLRFVFEELNKKPYLVAVINDQWTT